MKNKTNIFTGIWILLTWSAAALGLGAQGQIPSAFFTATPTMTPTAVNTLVPTMTFTSTPTPSPSPTPTSTPTVTSTPTITLTGTLQPTLTPTCTPSSTPTPTPTLTLTVTYTPTFTSTPGVFKFTVSPKPDSQGSIKFSWGTTIPADEAFLKIFTSGFRVVREFYFNKDENTDYLSAGSHDFSWDGRDDNQKSLPPSTYLCFIDVKVGKKKYEASAKTEIP